MQIIPHTTAMLNAEKVVKRSLPVSLGVTSPWLLCKQSGQLFSYLYLHLTQVPPSGCYTQLRGPTEALYPPQGGLCVSVVLLGP